MLMKQKRRGQWRGARNSSESWKMISLLLGDDQRALPVETGHGPLSSDE